MLTETCALRIVSDQPPVVQGRLYIGDPCYVIPDDLWSNFCKQMSSDSFKESHQYYVQTLEFDWFAANTAYGDGVYPVKCNGRTIGQCGVDAGMLAAIPMQVLTLWDARPTLGVVVNVPEPTPITVTRKGNWSIGNVSIHTS